MKKGIKIRQGKWMKKEKKMSNNPNKGELRIKIKYGKVNGWKVTQD